MLTGSHRMYVECCDSLVLDAMFKAVDDENRVRLTAEKCCYCFTDEIVRRKV